VKLPNGELALVDIAKIREYCLNPDHPRGRHKARVFAAALGLTAAEAHLLQDALLAAARTSDSVLGDQDLYGQRYVVEFMMKGPTAAASIRSVWIVRGNEDFPRFVSCYVR
jgi:hypothetical protein